MISSSAVASFVFRCNFCESRGPFLEEELIAQRQIHEERRAREDQVNETASFPLSRTTSETAFRNRDMHACWAPAPGAPEPSSRRANYHEPDDHRHHHQSTSVVAASAVPASPPSANSSSSSSSSSPSSPHPSSSDSSSRPTSLSTGPVSTANHGRDPLTSSSSYHVVHDVVGAGGSWSGGAGGSWSGGCPAAAPAGSSSFSQPGRDCLVGAPLAVLLDRMEQAIACADQANGSGGGGGGGVNDVVLGARAEFSIAWPPTFPVGGAAEVIELRAAVSLDAAVAGTACGGGGAAAAVGASRRGDLAAAAAAGCCSRALAVRDDVIVGDEVAKLDPDAGSGRFRARLRLQADQPGVTSCFLTGDTGVPSWEALQESAPLMALPQAAREEAHRLLWRMMHEALPPNHSVLPYDPDAFRSPVELLLPRLQAALCWAWSHHFRAFALDFTYLLTCLPPGGGDVYGIVGGGGGAAAAAAAPGFAGFDNVDDPAAADEVSHYQSVLAQMVGFLRDNDMFACLATLLQTAVARGLALVGMDSIVGREAAAAAAAAAAAPTPPASPSTQSEATDGPTAATSTDAVATPPGSPGLPYMWTAVPAGGDHGTDDASRLVSEATSRTKPLAPAPPPLVSPPRRLTLQPLRLLQLLRPALQLAMVLLLIGCCAGVSNDWWYGIVADGFYGICVVCWLLARAWPHALWVRPNDSVSTTASVLSYMDEPAQCSDLHGDRGSQGGGGGFGPRLVMQYIQSAVVHLVNVVHLAAATWHAAAAAGSVALTVAGATAVHKEIVMELMAASALLAWASLTSLPYSWRRRRRRTLSVDDVRP